MKTLCSPKYISTGLLLVLALGIAGCATSGYRTSERTAANLDALANRIQLGGSQMDIAVTELNSLVNNPQADLRPQFNRFSSAVKKLPTLTTSVEQADADLQARSRIQFENWDKELAGIQNEVIRANARARKTEVLAQFNQLRNNCLTVLTGYAPVQSDLQDIQRFLNSDLTLAGLTAIKDTAARATEKATPVREAVRKLVAEMKSVSAAISPKNGAAPAASVAPPAK